MHFLYLYCNFFKTNQSNSNGLTTFFMLQLIHTSRREKKFMVANHSPKYWFFGENCLWRLCIWSYTDMLIFDFFWENCLWHLYLCSCTDMLIIDFFGETVSDVCVFVLALTFCAVFVLSLCRRSSHSFVKAPELRTPKLLWVAGCRLGVLDWGLVLMFCL